LKRRGSNTVVTSINTTKRAVDSNLIKKGDIDQKMTTSFLLIKL
jgi:hypothetical protein